MRSQTQIREWFERDTADHVMTVIRDDGLYRHIRFARPGTRMYQYDLVTWPGYLAIVGDAGDFVFSRIRDMIEFFATDGGRINPHYWAQKLQGPTDSREATESYTHDAFRARLYEWARDEAEWEGMYESLLRGALDREVLFDYTHHRAEAMERLRDVEDAIGDAIFGDSWEWEMTEYDTQFIWCCHAIARGVNRYLESKKEAVA